MPAVVPWQIAAPDAGFAYHVLGKSARVIETCARRVRSDRWRKALGLVAKLLVQRQRSAAASAGSGRPL